ncbi:TetR/AcrR family transcriptional regulator [Leucobacter viscericola]|uniref:TetR/AcrR family transcriptional regulator n=1 Tax=Leucobacter viscericola TaxID=2714935 RepID=A0A6G7XCS4_9MICO|nr:TetR/AcrR family transcriptional regulator [Leucobacter viscericola]QIK62394.1 TetR/AcrR family transcriptional regulator [Leucobacter viscericola]
MEPVTTPDRAGTDTGDPAGDTTSSAPRTPRQLAREQTERELLNVARRHLGEVGAAGLSLRAIARECGLVSSAVYRYFESRDALLTVLILEAYDGLGEFVEQAERGVDRADLRQRFLRSAEAMRVWALQHPHQYALIYGSPVPGYAAPELTVISAARVGTVLFGVLRDAYARGARPHLTPALKKAGPAVLQMQRDFCPEIPESLVALGIESWVRLHGAISFEVFGQFNQMVTAPADLYAFIVDEELTRLGLVAGLASSGDLKSMGGSA